MKMEAANAISTTMTDRGKDVGESGMTCTARRS